MLACTKEISYICKIKYSIRKHNLLEKTMINRELIRIKIVQLTYAYYQNGNRNMDNAEKELLFSLAKAYDLL